MLIFYREMHYCSTFLLYSTFKIKITSWHEYFEKSKIFLHFLNVLKFFLNKCWYLDFFDRRIYRVSHLSWDNLITFLYYGQKVPTISGREYKKIVYWPRPRKMNPSEHMFGCIGFASAINIMRSEKCFIFVA